MEQDSIQFDSPLPVVHAWQDAANRRDIERLLELSDPNIEIIGPKGSGRGHQLLRDWLGRAGLTLQTQRAFVRGETVVLAQHGTWQPVDGGDETGEGAIASRFRVNEGRITQYARYDTLDAALAEAGLDAGDEMNEF
jgi:hypothetical protein